MFRPLFGVLDERRDWYLVAPFLLQLPHFCRNVAFVVQYLCKTASDMEPILECRTHPGSPEPSRLVTKRRCPFGGSPQQSKVAAREAVMVLNAGLHDTNTCAFELLMNSQRNQTKDSSPPDQMATVSFCICWVCHQQSEAMPCAFCEHSVCEMCVRQCDQCGGVFCAFCSTVNYENHDDRPLCLTCHHEELRLKRLKADHAATVQPSEVWEQVIVNNHRQLTT